MGNELAIVKKPVSETAGIVDSMKQLYYAPLVERRISRGELAEAARIAIKSGRENLQERVIDEVSKLTEGFLKLHEEAVKRDEEETKHIDERLNEATRRLGLATFGVHVPPSPDMVWKGEYLRERERVIDARRAFIAIFEGGAGDIQNYAYERHADRVSVVLDNPFQAGRRVGPHILIDDRSERIQIV